MAGLVLEGITRAAVLLDVAGVAVSRHYSTKAAKHEVVRVLAIAKLNTVHGHISTAVENCRVSDDEYKLILDEVIAHCYRIKQKYCFLVTFQYVC